MAPKLSLKKETITKLSDDQMKKVIGGLSESSSQQPTQSCNRQSCNSAGSGSCGDNSCNCTEGGIAPAGVLR